MESNFWIKLLKTIKHITFQPSYIRMWSLFINLNLSRYKHRHIITNWTQTHRKWNESNVWDTFFRLLTIYRICNRLNYSEKNLFKVNNFPGIG